MYNAAKLSVTERGSRVAAVVETLECDLELLCLTGVEDKLQTNVKQTLEVLRNAGMKVCQKEIERERDRCTGRPRELMLE